MRRGLALWLVLVTTLAVGCRTRAREESPPLDGSRENALRRAQVVRLQADREPIDLARNPPDLGKFGSDDLVECRFEPMEASGTTPKFNCSLRGGEIVKVKYGSGPEPAAEVAATRLLDAFGFGADRMYLIRRIRCYGCPKNPFRMQQATDLVRGEKLLRKAIDYTRWEDFEWAVVEREFEAREIAAGGAKGWAWWELERVDPSRGGASRAEVDAFRLMAIFLAHWDNKAENQRLVCRSGEADGQGCRQPFALIGDAGATFGPRKVDLAGWRAKRIWADAATCLTSMKDLPHRGATYSDTAVSEAGRKLLASRFSRLTEAQVRDLFVAARFAAFDGSDAEAEEINGWVAAFLGKVREITARGPCPR